MSGVHATADCADGADRETGLQQVAGRTLRRLELRGYETTDAPFDLAQGRHSWTRMVGYRREDRLPSQSACIRVYLWSARYPLGGGGAGSGRVGVPAQHNAGGGRG
jgi:hypothetical protein